MLPHLYHHRHALSQSATAATSEFAFEKAAGRPRLASLVPILTPPIVNGATGTNHSSIDENDDGHCQYILVPESRRIVVRSANCGRKVCDLVVTANDNDSNINVDDGQGGHNIHTVTLAWLPSCNREREDDPDSDDYEDDDEDEFDNNGVVGEKGEWIILAGCVGGIVHEWSVNDLSSTLTLPRRSFQLTTDDAITDATMRSQVSDLIHLVSPSSSDGNSIMEDTPSILYGLIDDVTSPSSWMVRFVIPPFVRLRSAEKNQGSNKSSNSSIFPLSVKNLASVSEGGSEEGTSYVCSDVRMKAGDYVFGMFVAYRLRSSKSTHDDSNYTVEDINGTTVGDCHRDTFVVMCTSRSIIVYRDTIPTSSGCEDYDNGASSSTTLLSKSPPQFVHLNESTTGGGRLISAAISPGTNDMALGRISGQIDILHDVFEYVSDRLDGRNQGGSRYAGGIVRRTLHWHSNPVRALTYAKAGRDGIVDNNIIIPATILSGGEESVLVAWELEQNYHRPSNFVSRVGRGGIVSILRCRHTGGIIVFCSDDTIQRFAGTSYERQWSVQGLASTELCVEEGGAREGVVNGRSRHGAMKSPIIIVKDPITKFPMLTNLPGAPGMVHWYDPRSASVIGTLEVAPFNRVSRKDPTSDPHIPTPTVTHMAVGHSGKDMVTVDMVWTENASVGVAYDLVGPRGMIAPMNVCTSIKFWRHIDSTSRSRMSELKRNRRNGDVPMSYELVSSMAAPHGRRGEVCALAVSPNGNVACTLSWEEDAFRIWIKNTESPVGLWKCHYKVKTPAGFASLMSRGIDSSSFGRQLVAFSTDGTVLSVSYGPYVTLWDHSDATLLTSLSLNNKAVGPSRANENIETVYFLTGNDDAMILTTSSQTGIKSPFGGAKSCYLGEDEWYLDVASLFGEGAAISAVLPLADNEDQNRGGGGLIAVSIATGNGSKSIISIINREKGALMTFVGVDMQWHIRGEVQSLYLEKHIGTCVQLLAITKDGQMLSLSSGIDDGHALSNDIWLTRNSPALAPILKIGNKAVDMERRSVIKRKVSISISQGGIKSETNHSNYVFPVLSGKPLTHLLLNYLGNKRGRSN